MYAKNFLLDSRQQMAIVSYILKGFNLLKSEQILEASESKHQSENW